MTNNYYYWKNIVVIWCVLITTTNVLVQFDYLIRKFEDAINWNII